MPLRGNKIEFPRPTFERNIPIPQFYFLPQLVNSFSRLGNDQRAFFDSINAKAQRGVHKLVLYLKQSKLLTNPRKGYST